MTQVLIVGAGPVGLTLASELTRYGVSVRIVDRTASRTDKSKAVVLWSRTLELLDGGGWEGAAPFVAAGHKLKAFTMMRSARKLGQIQFDRIASRYNYALALAQSETERLLEERLARQGIAVERGKEAGAFTFGPDAVGVTLADAGGQEESVAATWLVGCDGAHSTVRHALDVPFVGVTAPSDWILADVHVRGYPRPDTEGTIFWHRDGALLMIPMCGGRHRIIGEVPGGGGVAAASPSLETVQALVETRGPNGMQLFDPVWLTGFRINTRKVKQYRHGRVFLAGDAAHIHSPAGGQGMNTGMQDAFNLAWKLALVTRGIAKDDLLDTYSPERAQIGAEVLKATSRLTSIGTLKHPFAQGLRDFAGRMVLGSRSITDSIASGMAEVTLHYTNTALNGQYDGAGLKPGHRAPPLTRQDLPNDAGDTPCFVLHGASHADMTTLAPYAPALLDPASRPPLHPGRLTLVRPDGYVACSTHNLAAIDNYLCTWKA